MQRPGRRTFFDSLAPSISARLMKELREFGWLATLRACIFIMWSKMGRNEFTFPLFGHPFRVRGNRRKLGVDGMLYARREGFEPTLMPYFRLERSGTTFFDIGANYGYWSRFVLVDSRTRGVSDVSIVSFEPVPLSYDLLVANMKYVQEANDNIRCEQMAVSEQSGTCFMNPSNSDPGSAFVSDSGSIECNSTSIDAYVEARQIKNISLMKIDVEGFEMRVLQGARRTILRDRPLIVCEVIASHLERAGSTPEDVFREVAHLGYSYQRISDTDCVFRPPQ